MSKEVAKAKSAEVSTAVLDYGNDAGAGFDHSTTDDMVIPMVKILQALSPEVKDKEHPGEIGMFHNNVTDGVSESLNIVPVKVDRQFVEWKPRKEGGGRVGTYKPEDKKLDEYRALNPDSFPKIFTQAGEKGNQIVETYYLFFLLLNEDDVAEGYGVFPIKSMFITPYKKWNTSVKTCLVDTPSGRLNPPLYAHRVTLSTFEDRKNDDEFANVKFAPTTGDIKTSLLPPSSDVYQNAKDFLQIIDSGEAKVDFDKEAGGDAAGSTGEDTKQSF